METEAHMHGMIIDEDYNDKDNDNNSSYCRYVGKCIIVNLFGIFPDITFQYPAK
jgi:hypothetical protein